MTIQDIRSFFGDPIFTLIFSVFVSIFFYRLGTKRAKIRASIYGARQLTWSSGKFPENISIRYNDKAISQISQCYIVIWNAGNESLSKERLIESDPLRIEIADGEILEAVCLKKSHDSDRVDLIIDENKKSVIVDFDFIDAKAGFSIGMLHTAKDGRPDLMGRFKAHSIKKIAATIPYPRAYGATWTLRVMIVVTTVLFLMSVTQLFGVDLDRIIEQKKIVISSGDSSGKYFMGVITSMMYFGICITTYLNNTVRYPMHLAPRSAGASQFGGMRRFFGSRGK